MLSDFKLYNKPIVIKTVNTVLAQKQKYRSMEQDRKPRNKPTPIKNHRLLGIESVSLGIECIMLTPPEFKSEQNIHRKTGELKCISRKPHCIFSAKILDRNVS